MNDISLKQLEIFVAVVEYGGFTRAAEELFFNQSTVSAHISLLEQALGEKFDPTVYTQYLEEKYGEIYGL